MLIQMYFVYLGISLQQLLLIRILIFQFNLLPLHKKYIYKCLSLWKIPLSLQSSLEINVSLLRRYFNELSGDWLSWGCVRLPAKLIEQFSSRRAARAKQTESITTGIEDASLSCLNVLASGSAKARTSIMAKKKLLYAGDVYGTLTFEYL